MNSVTTLESAKADALTVVDEVLALVPEASIGEQRSITEAVLMECGDGEHKWPGGATVVVTDAFDADGFLSAVEGHFSDREHWSVSAETVGETPSVEARRADGLSVFTGVARGATEIWISSFSVCFPFDPVVGKTY